MPLPQLHHPHQLCPYDLTAPGPHISGTTQRWSCDWGISLSIMSSGFTDDVGCVRMPPLLRLNDIAVWMDFCLSIIHPWTFGLFLSLDCCEQCCMEHGATNIWVSAVSYFGSVPRSRVAGSDVVVFLTFGETTRLFATVTAPFTLIPAVGRLPGLHIFTNACCFLGYFSVRVCVWEMFGSSPSKCVCVCLHVVHICILIEHYYFIKVFMSIIIIIYLFTLFTYFSYPIAPHLWQPLICPLWWWCQL